MLFLNLAPAVSVYQVILAFGTLVIDFIIITRVTFPPC